jgi:outer membrane protein assembly factor BamD
MWKSSFKARWHGVLALFLLCGLGTVPADANSPAKPYVETTPKRGFHLFVRPKQKAPEAQWKFVQDLDRFGKTSAASKQALALRIWWPHSPEAPQAQMLYAHLQERRGKLQEAFDAYQFLMEHYVGHFEFNEVIDRQMRIAKTLMDTKKGKFLFMPGFAAPERAVPLFEKIVASAPEGRYAPEAYYLTGVANEKTFEYDKAIEAYFTALNRFPTGEYAEKSAFAQARCHIQVSDDSPNDSRALDTARAACALFLQRYPDSGHRASIEADRARLLDRQIENAYALAHYYDAILRRPSAALIEYKTFVALYPDAAQTPAARLRIEQLSQSQPTEEK